MTGNLDGSGQDTVVIAFPGSSIWKFVNDTWSLVHALNASRLAVGDADGDGRDDLIVDFGPSFGVWILRDDSKWSQLHWLASQGGPHGVGIQSELLDAVLLVRTVG